MQARNDNATPRLDILGGVRSICGNGSDRRRADCRPSSRSVVYASESSVPPQSQRAMNGNVSAARSSLHDGRHQRQQRLNVDWGHHCCLMVLRAGSCPLPLVRCLLLRVGVAVAGFTAWSFYNSEPLPPVRRLRSNRWTRQAERGSGGSLRSTRTHARIPEKNCLDVSRDLSSRFGRFLRPPPLESHPVEFAGSSLFPRPSSGSERYRTNCKFASSVHLPGRPGPGRLVHKL